MQVVKFPEKKDAQTLPEWFASVLERAKEEGTDGKIHCAVLSYMSEDGSVSYYAGGPGNVLEEVGLLQVALAHATNFDR